MQSSALFIVLSCSKFLAYLGNLPESRFGLELSPYGINILIAGDTEKLDQLHKLQGSILVDYSHVVCHKMIQNFYNLQIL